jgi:hypothetical protein
MSKYPIGRYDTGEIKHVYFRKHKHRRVRLIRKKMWLATIFKKINL